MMPPTEVQRIATAAEAEHLGTVRRSVATSVCRSCGKVHAPARSHRCLVCGGRDLQPGSAALRGAVESFTEVKAGKEKPTGLALVRLEAGPMLTVELVSGGQPVHVGARVAGVAVPGKEGEPRVRFRFALLPGEVPR